VEIRGGKGKGRVEGRSEGGDTVTGGRRKRRGDGGGYREVGWSDPCKRV